MNVEPPSGSRISVTSDGAHPLILIPHGRGPLRYVVRLFFPAWLVGWFAGFISEGWKLWSGEANPFLAHSLDAARRLRRVFDLSGVSLSRAGVTEADAQQGDMRFWGSPAYGPVLHISNGCMATYVSKEDARGD